MGMIEKTLSAAQGGISPMMGRIERMVAEMCPEGVKWVKLGDVFNVQNGYTPSKNQPEYWENGTIPWFRMEDIRTNGRHLSDSILHVTPQAVKKGSLFKPGSIIISTTATIGEYALINCDFLCNQQITCISPKKQDVSSRFFFHYAAIIGTWCKQNVNGAGLALLPISKLKELEIPLPPLPIQEAIADILDKFDRLSAELQAELQARKQQYEYYRNQLLTRFTPDQPVTEYSLGELCTKIVDGSHNPPQSEENGIYPMISAQNINNGNIDFKDARLLTKPTFDAENKRTKLNTGDVLLTIVGAVGRSAVVKSNIKAVFQRSVCVLGPDSNIINSGYLRFCLESKYVQKQISREANGAAQKGLYLKQVAQLKIHVPSLSEQARIVSILDKFEALVNDLSQGLPAEIAAVKEQYEYYRNKLLTFEKLL